MRFESGTQTISWFQKEYKEGTITLRPPYQRKPVWAARQKCYLIESILLEMPIPEIFVHETTTEEGDTVHAIVDGQQRIRTILQYLGLATTGPDGGPEVDEQEFTGFALDTFDRRPEQSSFLGKRFVDLSKEQRVKFFEYKFHIRYLYDATESDLRDMFTRLNRYLTALKPPELRNATYVGPFAQLAESLAEDEFWLRSGLVTRALIRRMGDVDFVSHLLIGVIHGPQGGSAAAVDEYYRMYEDYDLDEGFPEQRRAKRLFDQTLKLVGELFPDLQGDPDLRWSNRADFYSLFVALSDFIREHETPNDKDVRTLRSMLEQFSADVNRRLANERHRVPDDIVEYVRAVAKGVNDKARRADRHRVLLNRLEQSLGVTVGPLPSRGSGRIIARRRR